MIAERTQPSASELLIHDLRNPLATVHRFTELLRQRVAGQSAQIPGLDEGLHHIQDATERLERLVDQLADASTATSTRSTVSSPGQSDLLHLARQIAAESQPAAAGPDRVRVVSRATDLVGCWDPTALERVLGNLLDNALKYSPTDCPVVVTLERDAAWAVVSVADQGIGISDADRLKVFKRGFRGLNATITAPGNGIGLAAAQHIVDALGGTISIESELGVGTTVTVRLPLRRLARSSAPLQWGSGS